MKSGSPTLDRSQTFGRRLRAAREARGRTLRQIAETTKISASVLDALERDDPSKLPGGIFMRAFIRSFAAEIGLNPETTLQDFYHAFPAHAPQAVEEELNQGSPVFGGWQALAGGGAALLFVVATVAGGYALVTNPPDWLRWRHASAPDATAPEAVPAPAQPAPAEPAPAPTRTPAEESTPVAPVSPDLQRASVDAAEPPPAVLPASGPASTVQDATTPVSAPAAGGVQLAIHPRASCWVRITAAGRIRVARLMHAGEREIIDVAGPMTIEVGDAGAFDFSINGEPGRPLGPAGKVVRASISRDNLSAFLARP